MTEQEWLYGSEPTVLSQSEPTSREDLLLYRNELAETLQRAQERVAILESEAVAATRLFELQEEIAIRQRRIIEAQEQEIAMLKNHLSPK